MIYWRNHQEKDNTPEGGVNIYADALFDIPLIEDPTIVKAASVLDQEVLLDGNHKLAGFHQTFALQLAAIA